MFHLVGILRCSRDLANWIGPDVYEIIIAAKDYFHKVVGNLTIVIQNLKERPVIQNLPTAIDFAEDALTYSPVFKVRYTIKLTRW